MIIMMVALVAFAGLTYDAGIAFNARREATNIASSAARAGADDVDTNELYRRGVAQLSPGATGTARRAAQANGAESTKVRVKNLEEIEVKVSLSHETVFLTFIGIDRFDVEGEAVARVESRAE